MAIRKPKEDKVFDIINFIILLILALIVLYPLYFIVIASISDPDAVNGGDVTIYPIQPSLDGYARLFEDSSIWTGYRQRWFCTFPKKFGWQKCVNGIFHHNNVF